jgi:hypothetical protein
LLAADVTIPPRKGNVFHPFTTDEYGTDTIRAQSGQLKPSFNKSGRMLGFARKQRRPLRTNGEHSEAASWL